MLGRLVIRGLDLLARVPGCGFIGWCLVLVPVAIDVARDERANRGKTTPN